MTEFKVKISYEFDVVAPNRRAAEKFVRKSIEMDAITLDDFDVQISKPAAPVAPQQEGTGG